MVKIIQKATIYALYAVALILFMLIFMAIVGGDGNKGLLDLF